MKTPLPSVSFISPFARLSAPLLVLALLFTQACKHDPVMTGPVEPTPNMCDPDTVYFDKDVLPIIRSSCGMELCHDPITMTNGVQITSYESIFESDLVVPGDPAASKMYMMMTSTDPTMIMPPIPRGPISDNNIETIRIWIAQGALDNSCVEDTTCLIVPPVSFSQDVFPIIDKYCVGCHSGANPWAGLYLRTYDEVKVVADDQRLVNVINHAPGFPFMPRNLPKLSDCKIDMIEMWVADGAPNN